MKLPPPELALLTHLHTYLVFIIPMTSILYLYCGGPFALEHGSPLCAAAFAGTGMSTRDPDRQWPPANETRSPGLPRIRGHQKAQWPPAVESSIAVEGKVENRDLYRVFVSSLFKRILGTITLLSRG